MTSLADRTITALRAEHDTLAAVVGDLTDDQLTAASGAAEWTVGDVLSHLGSGAEITLAGMDAGLEGEAPPDGFNESVWDKWNARSPREQADGFLVDNAALVTRFEAFDADQRENVRLSLGFLPAPLSVAGFAGMRLDEVALHAWDVRAGLDPAATVSDESAGVLLDHLAGELSFLLGFVGKPDQVGERVVLAVEETGRSVVVDETVALSADPVEATATLTGGADAALRLVTGRLRPEFTPAGVGVTGNVTLDELRAVFPGF